MLQLILRHNVVLHEPIPQEQNVNAVYLKIPTKKNRRDVENEIFVLVKYTICVTITWQCGTPIWKVLQAIIAVPCITHILIHNTRWILPPVLSDSRNVLDIHNQRSIFPSKFLKIGWCSIKKINTLQKFKTKI